MYIQQQQPHYNITILASCLPSRDSLRDTVLLTKTKPIWEISSENLC